MTLVVDIGNSRLKWAMAEGARLTVMQSVNHQAAHFQATLLAQWRALAQQPVQLAISCVSHADVLQRVILLARQLWPTIVVVTPKAQAYALGVANAYEQPEKLGVDRWLALLAVRQLEQQPACVIDCGTAITIDFMNAQGQHLGGVISPGLMLMKRALCTGTEQLPYSETAFQAGLARHTQAAIYSGTLYAAAGLIEKVLSKQDAGFKLFLSGGDAALIAPELAVEATLYDDLVLRGLLVLINSTQRP